jgi:hypothetical protein
VAFLGWRFSFFLAELGELLSFLSVAAVDQAVIEQALKLPYHDLKSTLQMMAAVETGQTQSGAGGAERGVVDAIQQSK